MISCIKQIFYCYKHTESNPSRANESTPLMNASGYSYESNNNYTDPFHFDRRKVTLAEASSTKKHNNTQEREHTGLLHTKSDMTAEQPQNSIRKSVAPLTHRTEKKHNISSNEESKVAPDDSNIIRRCEIYVKEFTKFTDILTLNNTSFNADTVVSPTHGKNIFTGYVDTEQKLTFGHFSYSNSVMQFIGSFSKDNETYTGIAYRVGCGYYFINNGVTFPSGNDGVEKETFNDFKKAFINNSPTDAERKQCVIDFLATTKKYTEKLG